MKVPTPDGPVMLTVPKGTTSGKVLRLNDDGTVPADNPFVGRKGYKPEIFALGIRHVGEINARLPFLGRDALAHGREAQGFGCVHLGLSQLCQNTGAAAGRVFRSFFEPLAATVTEAVCVPSLSCQAVIS